MGFTKFDNTFLTGLMSLSLNGCEHAVILTILRHTLGFNRDEYTFSYSFLEKSTGKSRSSVRRAIKNLIDMEMVREVAPPTITSPRVLAINLGFFNENKCEEKALPDNTEADFKAISEDFSIRGDDCQAENSGDDNDLFGCDSGFEGGFGAEESHTADTGTDSADDFDFDFDFDFGNINKEPQATDSEHRFGMANSGENDVKISAEGREKAAKSQSGEKKPFFNDSFERYWFGDDYADRISGNDYSYDDFLRICDEREASEKKSVRGGATLSDFGVNLKNNPKPIENTAKIRGEGMKKAETDRRAKSGSDGKADNIKHGYGRFKNVMLTEWEYGQLFREFGPRVEGLINDFSVKLEAKGYNYKNHYAALLIWEAENRKGIRLGSPSEAINKPEPTPSGFDPEEFFQIALADSFRKDR